MPRKTVDPHALTDKQIVTLAHLLVHARTHLASQKHPLTVAEEEILLAFYRECLRIQGDHNG